jgi:hypothetical protein
VIGPDEAILILKGWLDSKSELLMTANMINFSMISKCQVVSVDGDKVTIWPVKGGAAAFTFSVASNHLELKYSRLREFEGKPGMSKLPPEKLDNSALMVTLPLQAVDADNPLQVSVETIILLEL